MVDPAHPVEVSSAELKTNFPVLQSLSNEDLIRLVELIEDRRDVNWLEHQRELFKIKAASALVAIPFAILAISFVLDVFGALSHRYTWTPDRWLVTVFTAVLSAAVAHLAMTLATSRKLPPKKQPIDPDENEQGPASVR